MTKTAQEWAEYAASKGFLFVGSSEPIEACFEQAMDEATAAMRADNDRLAQSVDGAYSERNQLVAALSKLFPAGQKKTVIDGWDAAWHNCVYIDLPTGQVSWHIHDREMAQFAHLPAYNGEWDGHDTPEKYRRLAALSADAKAGEVG